MNQRFDIEIIRQCVVQGRIQWHQHALERCLERGISRAEVIRAILNGEVIEVYLTDRPYSSCLLLLVEKEPVHVVVSADPVAGICHVITGYRPDSDHFEEDYRTRRTTP